MKLQSFQLHHPETVEEVIALRSDLGDEAAVYAGGTELLLAMKLGVISYSHLIDVKKIPDLDEVTLSDGVLKVGATVTHRALETNPQVSSALPALAQLERRVANVRVRAMGTLAGNLAFAEPHADPPALLLALGARVVLAGQEGSRRVAIDDFVVGAYETVLAPDELIVGIEIPVPAPSWRVAYRKFQVLERPSIGVAAMGDIRDGVFATPPTIVVGAVDEMPHRVPAEVLSGVSCEDRSALEEVSAATRSAVEPVDDLSGSADYKRHLSGVLTMRVLDELAGRKGDD
jgi:carbon-monoxide dehydrogenase medium subunit